MSSTLRSAVIAALAGAVSVSAHGHVTVVKADGKSYTGFDPTSAPFGPQPDSITWGNGATDNGFVLSSALQDPDIICHLDATNAPLTAPVAAGSDVTITWNQWPDSHKGPVIDYLADCGGDCATVDKTTLKWFKISELGQLELGRGSGQTGRWADDLIIENGLTWSVTIPASIKAGNYVLRHELIALHEGGSQGKAQLYPQCINLQITGSGTQVPEGVVGTQLYTATDPGILHNIYNDENLPSPDDYIIPGPPLPVFDGSSSGGSGNSGSSSSAAPAPTSTTAAPTSVATPTSTAVVSSTPAPEPVVSTPAASSSAAVPEPVVSTPVTSAVPTPTRVVCNNSKRRARRHARQLKNLN
ncbi:lytic polysaccharide monooxygenase [Durotheca rogersii]|uniref:lytic polysaccharide monooxygenase n=1 Tax=Durotheca rogersii TaxID=419775 RepID=UPI00221F7A26|nr:lytic polysaccharide monooxygenase [Durotheca rogersii]KAI5861915.1 lytic polysaccharide monooxygenase [Durotheca rogersii]